jgi:hypothetical protein
LHFEHIRASTEAPVSRPFTKIPIASPINSLRSWRAFVSISPKLASGWWSYQSSISSNICPAFSKNCARRFSFDNFLVILLHLKNVSTSLTLFPDFLPTILRYTLFHLIPNRLFLTWYTCRLKLETPHISKNNFSLKGEAGSKSRYCD